jgi:hypothetical protein
MSEISGRRRDDLLNTSIVHDEGLSRGPPATAVSRTPAIEPVTVTISEGKRISGLSHSEIYRRLARGDIRAVKSGSRTLILMDSLRQHLASLPPAKFKGTNRSA